MSHWFMDMLRAAPKEKPDGAMCIFDHNASAVGLFELDKGCVCHPEQRQHLCIDHAIKSTPLGGFEIVHGY